MAAKRGTSRMRRIVCLGGGPVGLYAAILLRKALPSARIEVYERNRPDDTFGGRRTLSGGHGFCGISRKLLLGLLQERARELGVHQVFQHQVDDDSGFRDAALIIAADGV